MAEYRKKTLLVIDDDTLFCGSVCHFFECAGFRTEASHLGGEGLALCSSIRADVVLLDQKLPDYSGLDLCTKILEIADQTKIIFITAYPSFDHAVQALRRGACDYLSKPMELEELELAVTRAVRTSELERLEQIHRYKSHNDCRSSIMVGKNGGLAEVNELVSLAARSRAPVLITGETGTGKNVVAKAIHYFQGDESPSFVSANCAALPESLIESEFFGHERGAFTGAASLKKGLFEMADCGTLFLDEIGELPLHLQAKLLGVLDEGIFRRVGGNVDHKVDVQVVAATNVDLEKAIAEKRFREDLYYRMSVMRIHLPPLRERTEDIRVLAEYFIENFAPDQKVRLPDNEIPILQGYHWPGNVRELKNIIERSIILRNDNTIYPSIILAAGVNNYRRCSQRTENEEKEIKSLAEVEKAHIARALAVYSNNHTHVARALGIARSTLIRKLERYGFKIGVSTSDTVLKQDTAFFQ